MTAGSAISRLPKRDLHVPSIGIGGAALGGMHGPVSERSAADAMDAAWDRGVRYFDTAPLYGHGLGELRTGAALRSRDRGSYVLSTKTGWLLDPLARGVETSAGTLPFWRKIDYSYDGTMRSVEASLLRLGMGHIDIAFVHDVDPYNHGDEYPRRFGEVMEGALIALARLRDEGVVKAIGIGVNNCDVCLQFLRGGDLDCILIAGRFTLLDMTAGEELLPECLARNVGVIVGATFNSGLLAATSTGKFNHCSTIPAEVANRLAAISELCGRHGISVRAAALQFPLRHEAVVSVLPGIRSGQQLDSLVDAANENLPAAFWAEFDEIAPIDRTR